MALYAFFLKMLLWHRNCRTIAGFLPEAGKGHTAPGIERHAFRLKTAALLKCKRGRVTRDPQSPIAPHDAVPGYLILLGAVTFLVRVKEALEDPRRLLMDL